MRTVIAKSFHRGGPGSPVAREPSAAGVPVLASPVDGRLTVSQRVALGLALAGLAACSAGGATVKSGADAPGEGGIELVVQEGDAADATAPVDRELACVTPLDPKLEDESPWQEDLGKRIDEVLEGADPCHVGMAPEETGWLALRLLYDETGQPTSQHVISATPSGCAAARCLTEKVANIHAAGLKPGQAGYYDLGLLLEGGERPLRSPYPVDPLGGEAEPAACVDPEIARLSRSKVREAIGDTHKGLKQCYDRALVRNHSAEGKVTFELLISRSGAVERAFATESTLYDCEAIECMLGKFRELDFPPPLGRTLRVRYPVTYTVQQYSVRLQ